MESKMNPIEEKTVPSQKSFHSHFYNLDNLVEYLTGCYHPAEVVQRLQLVYCTLAEYLIRDTNCVCDRNAVADAMCTLRELQEVIEQMNSPRQ